MDASTTLTELEQLAEKVGVQVSYDHFTGDGAGPGGLCRVKGQWRAILERRASATEKAAVLARCLSRFDLESHYVSPAVRELLERQQEPD